MYWQVKMNEGDKADSLCLIYGISFMPFGLPNAPVKFQMLMETSYGLISGKCLRYLDDIIMFGSDVKEVNEILKNL